MYKRQRMKFFMVTSVLALTMMLFAQQALAGTHVIFRNSSSGDYAFLKLNANGTLKNTTGNQGIGRMTQGFPGAGFSFAGIHEDQGTPPKTNLIISNADGSRYAFLKMNANGTLANTTNNQGIAWINPASLNLAGWSYVGTQHDGNQSEGLDHLIFQNTNTGALGFVKLNSNGTIKNETGNDGFGRINFGLDIPNSWRAIGIQENVRGDGRDHIILANSANGNSAFIRLNANGTLANATANQGFGRLYPSNIQGYTPVFLESRANTGLVFKNPNGGTQAFAYLKLNANGTIQNLTRGNGWDFIQNRFDLSSFDVLGSAAGPGADNHLLLRNANGGRVAFIKLNANGTANNDTVNNGIAWVNPDFSGEGWRAEGIDVNGLYTD